MSLLFFLSGSLFGCIGTLFAVEIIDSRAHIDDEEGDPR